MSFTTLASWPLLIWRALEDGGHDPRPVFNLADIDPQLLGDAGSRVTESRLERCWIEASRVSAGEGCFGLEVARHWHPTTLHALGIACLASHTLMEAFERFVRFLLRPDDANERAGGLADSHLKRRNDRSRNRTILVVSRQQ